MRKSPKGIRSLTARVGAIGLALALAVITAGTANAAEIHHSSDSGLRFMSAEEYVHEAGVAAAKAHGIEINPAWLKHGGTTPIDSTQGPLSTHPDPWWTILAEQRDESGIVVPIRQGKSDAEWQGGDSGAGFNHACADHNLCNETGMKVALSETGQLKTPDRYLYSAVVVDSELDVEATIDLAASRTAHGFGDSTPDGLAFGLVTAYCVGYADCPEWVNGV